MYLYVMSSWSHHSSPRIRIAPILNAPDPSERSNVRQGVVIDFDYNGGPAWWRARSSDGCRRAGEWRARNTLGCDPLHLGCRCNAHSPRINQVFLI